MGLASVDEASRLFAAAAGACPEADLRAPSSLPGWSRAHVVAHVALNAEAFVRAAAALREGRVGVMYAGGMGARERDIEALAARSRDTLLERLTAADIAFARTWDPLPPEGTCATTPDLTPFASAGVPGRRLRELQVHLVDLGLPGVGPDRWTGAYVDMDLALQWPTVSARTPLPVVVVDERGGRWTAGAVEGAGESPLTMDRAELLAWVLDRRVVEGLPHLEPWGDRSRWEHRLTPAPEPPPTGRGA